ncbi:SMI1/KNR4 family protein [Xanthomonas campestris]|uniref:SMI1/KNR4 family protein n=1 Tax=Xanthomonas campestris TaxID=339 RepID=UPI001E355700|nr:SMI1/KNR4 family protein [Xanthomonas campestris]MCC5046962.1 SMI1/KNR4 family protein [Xanthomonas campestris]MCC5056442.1 SMI1/KNR4 family protein [Xanthomonas campestris]MCC5060747.1 SMI1/KNR4 family protein [Xanthomonas campestris]MEA9550393.1 SMI1/KNR4 family protein [Xanthomonas campestris]MEB1024545.1 SMI1/KNR4 family protein [Xanthomonas campestris pv. campestris]
MAGLEWKVYGRAPTLDTFWDEALNLGRSPATDASIAAAQARLGVRLPDWLRHLYARYDGGAVQMARGQSLQQPDNWLAAEWLIPRARLLGAEALFSFAQVRAREDYRDDAYAGLAASGDDRWLIAIAADARAPSRALCLDYAAPDTEPSLVYVDAGSGQRLIVFDGVEDLLAQLVDVVYWSPALQAKYDDNERVQWQPQPPALETFWSGPGHWNDTQAVADTEALAAAEARLGVRLPALFKRLYGVQDGGDTGWCWVPRTRFPSDRYVDWECVLVDRYLSPLAQIGSVLDFAAAFEDPQDFSSVATLHAGLDQVLVLSSHNVDCLLCLDYRGRGPQYAPEVVYFERWEGLHPTWRAPSFEAFFSTLRQADLDF